MSHLRGAASDETSTIRSCSTIQLKKCRKLVKLAKNCLHDGSNYYYSIEACNEVLEGGYKIDPKLEHECLCLRAALLLKRKWKNDAHIAVKDLNKARKIDSSSLKALLSMSEALSQAVEMVKKTPAYKNKLRALELERSGGTVSFWLLLSSRVRSAYGCTVSFFWLHRCKVYLSIHGSRCKVYLSYCIFERIAVCMEYVW